MGPFAEVGLIILQTLASLYLLTVMLRFLFQLVRADFYNPISQFMVKVTNPVLMPLRKLIPGVFGIDMAALVLALIIQFITIQLSALMIGAGFQNPGTALVWGLVGLISMVVNIYFWGLLISVIVSWVAPQSFNPALMLLRQLIEPIMTPFRRLIPPIGGLDISPIFVFLALNIIQSVLIKYLAYAVGMSAGVRTLVLGIT